MNYEEQLKKAGVHESWYVLADALQDSGFDEILTNQERNVMNNLKSNVSQVKSYSEYVVNIVSKYHTWKLYKDSKLDNLKSTVKGIQNKIDSSKRDLDELTKFSEVAKGATALTAYAKIFETRAIEHKNNAGKNLKYYILSLVILFIVIGLVFFVNVAEFNFVRKFISDDIQMTKFSIGIYAFKAIVLLFFFQVVQFFRKNYNAEKHLEEINTHRSDVMKSLHAVYISIDTKEEKEKILSTGAILAFERGETGYISTKEGAGSGDGSIESVISRILK